MCCVMCLKSELYDELIESKAILDHVKYVDVFNDKIPVKTECENLIIMHRNVRGLVTNESAVKHLLSNCEHNFSLPDIVLFCETFLNAKNSNSVNLNGYQCESLVRENKHGGGINVYINSDFNYKVIYSEVCDTHEALFVKIPKLKLIIGELYRIPNTPYGPFLNCVEKLITLSNELQCELVIGSDCNLDLLKNDTHKGTGAFVDLLSSNNLLPTVTIPTRLTSDTSTLIDNIFCSIKLLEESETFVFKTDISDHYPCMLSFAINVHRKTEQTFTYRKMNDEIISQINNHLEHENWDAD